MAVVLSLAWGAIFIAECQAAVLAGAAAFSHFLADIPMHNADLALFPNAATHFGLGLWGRLCTGAWLLEGLFSASLIIWAWRVFPMRRVSVAWPVAVMIILFVQLSPWLSPMKWVARLPEPQTHILDGLLVSAGFLVPGVLLSWLTDRAERLHRPPSIPPQLP